jgi:hypothetical protein
MLEEMTRFCAVCGFFRLNYTTDVEGSEMVSPTWEKAHEGWRRNPPVLTRFPEPE